MKKKTSLNLDQRVWARIKQEAARQRRSMSGLVSIWLEEKFAPVPVAKNGAKQEVSA